MVKLTKEWLEKKLKAISKGIDESEQDDYNWYLDILWEDFENEDDSIGVIEEYFAKQAVKYPELHPLMREIVEKLININSPEDEVSLDGESAGGSFFATELALVNEKDVLLYAELFQSTDPDHEEPSYFEESFAHIIKKYGWNKIIYPLLYAHSFVHSQHNLEIFTIDDAKKLTENLKKDGNLDEFLKGLAEWTNEYEYYDYQLENVFRILLDEALNLENDEAVENAVEKFESIKAKGNIPKESDFKNK